MGPGYSFITRPHSFHLKLFYYSLAIAKVITPAKIKNSPMQPLTIIRSGPHQLKIAKPPNTKNARPKTTLRSVDNVFLASQHVFLVSQPFFSSTAICTPPCSIPVYFSICGVSSPTPQDICVYMIQLYL